MTKSDVEQCRAAGGGGAYTCACTHTPNLKARSAKKKKKIEMKKAAHFFQWVVGTS